MERATRSEAREAPMSERADWGKEEEAEWLVSAEERAAQALVRPSRASGAGDPDRTACEVLWGLIRSD